LESNNLQSLFKHFVKERDQPYDIPSIATLNLPLTNHAHCLNASNVCKSSNWHSLQRLLALIENLGDAHGNNERVVEGTELVIDSPTLDESLGLCAPLRLEVAQ
jgi:hypothetical protein